MKKIAAVGLLCVMAVSMAGNELWAKAKRKKSEKNIQNQTQSVIKESGTFDVYTDKMSRANHYIPSGYMGDYGDIKVNDNWKEQPRSGVSCVRIEYNINMSQGAGWAGIFWQNPANNWGTRKGGYDLTGAKRLVFWARGEKGGEYISEFKIGGITGEYSDTDAISITDIELTKNWKKYEINLEDADLTSISGGFCWAANLTNNPNGCVFFLDDIIYEFDGKKKSAVKEEDKTETIQTETAPDNAPVGETEKKGKRNKYLNQ